MEILESELEIYNSKMRLLNWLFEELKLFSKSEQELIKEKSRNLPLNL
ncbi:MAG: hypothetical protein P8Y97_06425 [Candidatus Lokiarchaeota archaeon]